MIISGKRETVEFGTLQDPTSWDCEFYELELCPGIERASADDLVAFWCLQKPERPN